MAVATRRHVLFRGGIVRGVSEGHVTAVYEAHYEMFASLSRCGWQMAGGCHHR